MWERKAPPNTEPNSSHPTVPAVYHWSCTDPKSWQIWLSVGSPTNLRPLSLVVVSLQVTCTHLALEGACKSQQELCTLPLQADGGECGA